MMTLQSVLDRYVKAVSNQMKRRNRQNRAEFTANCLQLGYMDGGLTNTLSEDFLKQKIEAIPAKRLGRVDEIAHAVKFLIENEYVNGATLKLTGGL